MSINIHLHSTENLPLWDSLAVSGAQSVEIFMQALQKTQTICEEGRTCGPDGC